VYENNAVHAAYQSVTEYLLIVAARTRTAKLMLL